MSRRYEDNCGYYANAGYPNAGFPNVGFPGGGLFGGKSCVCSLPTLIILILIILQFSKKGKRTSSCTSSSSSSSSYSSGHGKLVDNSILFIIALFYLTCANPCKKGY